MSEDLAVAVAPPCSVERIVTVVEARAQVQEPAHRWVFWLHAASRRGAIGGVCASLASPEVHCSAARHFYQGAVPIRAAVLRLGLGQLQGNPRDRGGALSNSR